MTTEAKLKCQCGEESRPICDDYEFRQDDNGEQFDECIHCLHAYRCHAPLISHQGS